MLSKDEILEQLKELGCGDGGCIISKPTGMQTNGGCQCLKDLHWYFKDNFELYQKFRKALMLRKMLCELK